MRVIIAPIVIHERFDHIWQKYPEPYKGVIDEARKRKPVSIVTNDADINRTVKYAGYLDGVFYFRWKQIPVEMLDGVIVHEIAHYYVDAREGYTWMDYCVLPFGELSEQRMKVELHLVRVEVEAIKVEIDVRAKLGIPPRAVAP